MEGNIEVAKEHLTTYFLGHDEDITQEQASYLANVAMKVLQTAGQIAVHQVAARGFNKVRKGSQLKTRQGGIGEVGKKNVPATRNNKEPFNFSGTTLNHMNDPNRSLPVSILKHAIKNGKGLPDPQGTKALMYYTQIIRNRKTYNLEVLYDQATNTISHFMYTRDPIGPLKAIPKSK